MATEVLQDLADAKRLQERKFSAHAREVWQRITVESEAMCGIALQSGECVIADDIESTLYSTRGTMQIKATNLDKQSLEHAAADQESSALSWIGRVMVAPQVRDR
jgi:hypothetical protein